MPFSDDLLPPWAIDQVERVWNDNSKGLKLRAFSLGKSGSKAKAATRLSLLLKENAEWLDGSRKTDVEVLLDRFISKLIAA